MNKKQLTITFLFLVSLSRLCFAQEVIGKNTMEEKTCSDYKIKIYKYEEEGNPLALDKIEIYKKDKLVFKDEDKNFNIGNLLDDTLQQSLVEGCQDITGDGAPDLVISSYSGGAHCCSGLLIFQLGNAFKLLDKIDTQHSDGQFKDINGDGILEIIARDWAFAYWNAAFFESPAPEIILKYKNGRYVLALDLMKKFLPKPEEEDRLIQEINTKTKQVLSSEKIEQGITGWIKDNIIILPLVWGQMLDLIYTGHPKESWVFLDKVWPEGKPGKEEFISDFKRQLTESHYWKEIRITLE